MGREATCRARFEGRTTIGRAQLETDFVSFRADGVRVKVPFVQITTVETNGGSLRLVWDGESLELELGAQADAWADRITNPPTLMDKLGVKPGMRVSLVGVEDEWFVEQLRGRDADVRIGRAAIGSDLVFLRATSVRDLRALDRLRRSIASNGGIWVVSPRGNPSLRDVDVMAAAREAGLVDVKVARFSDADTALKLVIPVADR